MTKNIVLTPEGVKKLRDELEHLKKVRRPEITERIKSAKEYGDLSENAEYHEAEEEQGFIEGRVIEIEEILKIAEVVDKKSSTTVGVGSKVTVERNGSEIEYQIVGATEADPLTGLISLDSPLGEALLEKSAGDSVIVQAPTGPITYRVTKIA